MRRRTKLIAGALAALVAAGAAVAVWPRKPSPCRATFEQVTVGMTREEVEGTVGGPPGRYNSGADYILVSGFDGGRVRHESWVTPEGELLVAFDEEGRATAVRIRVVQVIYSPPRPFFDRLRARLGL